MQNLHGATQRPNSTAPACAGTARCVSGPVPPAACKFVLAPRRFRYANTQPAGKHKIKVKVKVKVNG